MRKPATQAYQPTSSPLPLPAPTGGWNARDPLASMKSTDAVFMDNVYPGTGNVSLRKGSELFATLPEDDYPASPHTVKSLMSYSSPTGNLQLFAGLEDGIYNVTTGGDITVIDTPATDGAWISVNITTAGGSFLWCCNGVDDSRYFNGLTWTVLSGALTGIVSNKIAHVNLHKFRLMFCCKDSLSFWYLPVNSIAGAALEFPLGALFSRGGYLMATGTWTLDGGNGPDDYFVAITSNGEVAVYSGTDPSSAADWALVGVYFIGAPIGRKCTLKMSGELYIITAQSLYPMSSSLELAGSRKKPPLSDKISQAWIQYANNFKDLYGWSATFFAQAGMMLVNVPILSQPEYVNGLISYQFVLNTQTGAWCRFFGLSGEAWTVHDGKLFFAGRNKVYQAWLGTTDRGSTIDGRVKQAFITPAAGNICHVTLIRPILTGGELNIQTGIDVDYNESITQSGTSSDFSQRNAAWDSAIWDEDVWSAGALTNAKWRSVSHMPGIAISLRLRINQRGATMAWTATNMIIQGGGMM